MSFKQNAVSQSEEPPDEGSLSTTTHTFQDMKSQIEVLVSSLLTVTQQKERLEASCLAERKQLRVSLKPFANRIKLNEFSISCEGRTQ